MWLRCNKNSNLAKETEYIQKLTIYKLRMVNFTRFTFHKKLGQIVSSNHLSAVITDLIVYLFTNPFP